MAFEKLENKINKVEELGDEAKDKFKSAVDNMKKSLNKMK